MRRLSQTGKSRSRSRLRRSLERGLVVSDAHRLGETGTPLEAKPGGFRKPLLGGTGSEWFECFEPDGQSMSNDYGDPDAGCADREVVELRIFRVS